MNTLNNISEDTSLLNTSPSNNQENSTLQTSISKSTEVSTQENSISPLWKHISTTVEVAAIKNVSQQNTSTISSTFTTDYYDIWTSYQIKTTRPNRPNSKFVITTEEISTKIPQEYLSTSFPYSVITEEHSMYVSILT